MASAANDSSKRRRLLNDASVDASCLSDLPSGVLTNVANYLDAPSRLLFAAALTTHQIAAASDERNSAIVGNEWTTLDFGDIEKDLAVKLNDDDIEKVLQSIDAVNRVKKLKLTNCINITGVGLEPLRGSTIIEQIDLSLVGDHQSPNISPKPSISCKFVLPILDSIIEREGCSLRHLQFPWSWRGKSIQFEQFLMRHNEMLDNRSVGCVTCNTNLPPGDWSWIGVGERNLQNFTCYECLKYYCDDCKDVDDDKYMLSYCSLCEKRLCSDCQKNKWCVGCEVNYCVGCRDFTECSRGCDTVFCEECIAFEVRHSKCYKCEVRFCHDSCADYEISTHCDSCKKSCCNDCHAEYHQDDDWPSCNRCRDCFCDDCNEKKGILYAIQTCDSCYTSYCGDCREFVVFEGDDVTCEEDEGNKNCAGCVQLAGLIYDEKLRLRNGSSFELP